MKKKTTSSSTLSYLRVLASLLILLFSVFLLTTGLVSKASAQADNNRQFPLPNLFLQEQKVVPSDVGTDSYFGRAVAIDGPTALISAFGDNDFQGAAYLFTESNGIWSEGQKLTASDGRPGDRFGNSVVLAGDILVIGASEATVNGASSQGAVYVFRKSGNTWVESQKLIASDGAETDAFGTAIALSGRTLVVGAPNARVNDHFHQGAAYVFVETNGIWRLAQKLTGDDSVDGDNFGSAVAARGSMILVGAPNKDLDNFVTGEVYVFSRSNNSWNQNQSLIGEDSGFFAAFGASLALDNAIALVGAPHATANGHGAQGAAYVFGISGGTLTQTQMITSSDGASNDAFASTVALAGNLAGNRALIGAPFAQAGGQQGKAYIFGEMDGNWDQIGRIIANDGGTSVVFGWAVALDRDTALVGTTPAFVPFEGAAYFYSPAAGNLP
jgi:hypothetical protein